MGETTVITDVQSGIDVVVSKLFIGPDTIFTGGVSLLNANIFEATTGVDPFQSTNLVADSIENIGTDIVYGSNFAGVIKKGIATTYVILRNICAMIMLAGLLFTGIRILITSNTPSKMAQWRQLLQDWLIGMVLLIFSHVIMYGVFWISDTITDALADGLLGFGGLNFTLVRTCIASFDSAVQIICLVMLGYLIYLTVIFMISYFKRLLWVCVLIVIAPIVSTMYAFGNQTKRIYSNWIREYITTVLVQPFHLIVYYVLVSIPLNMVSTSPFEYEGLKLFTIIYALGALSFIKPAEKYVRHLMQMDQGIAQEASFDSGKQTVDGFIDTFSDIMKKATIIAKTVATGGATAPELVSEFVETGEKSAVNPMDMLGKSPYLIESQPGKPTPTDPEPLEEDSLKTIGDIDPDLMLADLERKDIYGNFARDQFHDDYFAGDMNFDNDLQNLPNTQNKKMNEAELQGFLDNLGLEEDSEERNEMESDLRKAGHGNKQIPKDNTLGDIDPDLMLADLEREDIYGNFARDQFHDDYFAGDIKFDNDLQNIPNAQSKKMNEEELKEFLDNLGLEEGSEERADMERTLRDIEEPNREEPNNETPERIKFVEDDKLKEEELQEQLDNLGLEKGSEERADMEKTLRELGYGGIEMPEKIKFADDNLAELENVNLDGLQKQLNELELGNLDSGKTNENDQEIKIEEKDPNNIVLDNNKTPQIEKDTREIDSGIDLDKINASNVNISASNVGLNYNGDEERNKGAIERIDSTENAKRNLESDTKQDEINAASINILASNVDLKYNKQDEEIKKDSTEIIKEENKEEDKDNKDTNDTNELENQKNIAIEIDDTGKDYSNTNREKDDFLTRRLKEWNAAVDFSKGETTLYGAINKLSEDSLLRSMPGKIRDSETYNKLRNSEKHGEKVQKAENFLGKSNQYLKAFDEAGLLKDIHKGYHTVKDTFYVGGATGDWKNTNARMETAIKESQEQAQFNIVNNEKNQNYVIMKENLMEKYRERYKGQNKSEEYLKNLAKKEAKEKLQSVATTYVPLGIKDPKIMIELDDDRKKYGISAREAIERRANYEKFNINVSNTEYLQNYYKEEKVTSVQEALPQAREYYNAGYVEVADLRRVHELTDLLKVTPDYGMKLDKILDKKGPDVKLNLEKRKDISDAHKENIKKFIEENYVINKGL